MWWAKAPHCLGGCTWQPPSGCCHDRDGPGVKRWGTANPLPLTLHVFRSSKSTQQVDHTSIGIFDSCEALDSAERGKTISVHSPAVEMIPAKSGE